MRGRAAECRKEKGQSGRFYGRMQLKQTVHKGNLLSSKRFCDYLCVLVMVSAELNAFFFVKITQIFCINGAQ